MKYILELILAVIIIFFVWNILKRLFFTQFYRNPAENSKNFGSEKKSSQKINQKVKWDAETVDYEEVKDEKKTE